VNIKTDDISFWAESLPEFSPEYSPVKCWSVLQFYTLAGRKSTISKENMIPIPDLKYCVLSQAENRYYMREFRVYPLEVLFFYEPDTMWDSWDAEINSLRRYIDDRRLNLLFTAEQVAETTSLLSRLYKWYFSVTGKLPYKTYIRLLHENLKYEDYKDKCKETTGFKTVCNMYEIKINELWMSAKTN